MRVESVCVVGGGSAGFLAALALKRSHPDLPVVVLRSAQHPIIGVGEATTWAVPAFLHDFVRLDRRRFFREVRPAFKTAVRLHFGPRDHFDYTFEGQMVARPPGLPRNVAWYCRDDLRTPSLARETCDLGRSPLLRMPHGGYLWAAPIGYHIENGAFVAHLEAVAREDGIEIVEATLTGATRREGGGIDALLDDGGRAHRHDLYVDCSGFESRLLRGELGVPFRSYARSLFCDRAVVGGWERDRPILPFTGAHTLSSGWAFVTEHWDRINCGYVYSGAHQRDDDAEREFRAFTGGRVGPTRVVPYVSGRAERAWEHNVVAIGNSSGFVEPLQSTGLHLICDLSRALAHTLGEAGFEIAPAHRRHFNRLFAEEWDQVRVFLALHYALNTRLDTPFWRAARAETDLAGGEEALAAYREAGPTALFENTVPAGRGLFGWDGILTLLVGMGAPCDRPTPPEGEQRLYREVVGEALQDAPLALPMQAALDRVCADNFYWYDGSPLGLPLHPSAQR